MALIHNGISGAQLVRSCDNLGRNAAFLLLPHGNPVPAHPNLDKGIDRKIMFLLGSRVYSWQVYPWDAIVNKGPFGYTDLMYIVQTVGCQVSAHDWTNHSVYLWTTLKLPSSNVRFNAYVYIHLCFNMPYTYNVHFGTGVVTCGWPTCSDNWSVGDRHGTALQYIVCIVWDLSSV